MRTRFLVGLLAGADGTKNRWSSAAIVTAASIALCLPWTARNCARLDRCAFVSANGGWNLYIGSSPLGRGGFAPVDAIGVPAECRTVFGEGGKDRCFGRAGLERIAAEPGAWLSLVPAKLGMTFDYGTAAAHYLSGGKVQKTSMRFADNAQLMNICQRIVSQVGRRVDESSPICDARLPDGSRVNVIAPPLAMRAAAAAGSRPAGPRPARVAKRCRGTSCARRGSCGS